MFIKCDIEKTRKMSRLQVFWSTQACTIPDAHCMDAPYKSHSNTVPTPGFINCGFMYQRVGCSQLLIIILPLFDPQRNKDEIAVEQLQQIHCNLVWVEVIEDHLKDGSRPILEFEDPA